MPAGGNAVRDAPGSQARGLTTPSTAPGCPHTPNQDFGDSLSFAWWSWGTSSSCNGEAAGCLGLAFAAFHFFCFSCWLPRAVAPGHCPYGRRPVCRALGAGERAAVRCLHLRFIPSPQRPPLQLQLAAAGALTHFWPGLLIVLRCIGFGAGCTLLYLFSTRLARISRGSVMP